MESSNVTVSENGGNHVVSAPLTTQVAREAAPGLLLNEIDRRVVKLRPMSTPVDQISRYAAVRKAGSMVVDFYSVDTKDNTAEMQRPFKAAAPTGAEEYPTGIIYTTNDSLFDTSETILCPDIFPGGGTEPLCLYVIKRGEGGGVTVIAINGNSDIDNGVISSIPDLPAKTKLVRMGRAAGELDVQTPQFEALPKKSQNFCQIFKAQVEQSSLMRSANKEVGWTFNDQEEVAIFDMRLGLEKSFLFGRKARIYDPVKQTEIYLTGGIYYQAKKQENYSLGKLDNAQLVRIMRSAFTGNSGSKRKILFAGSGLIEALNNLDAIKVVGTSDVVTKWGLDFHEIHSKFGTLYVIHNEVFDMCNHENDGLIVDPEYLTKYSHVPFNAARLDLQSSGQRNTEAVVITEASCLVLRHPDAHMRVVGAE